LKEKPEVLFGPDQIARRIAEVGAEIGRAFEGREICVVGLMKSCLVFMADLIRAIPSDLTVHLVRVSSTRDEGSGIPAPRSSTPPPSPTRGRTSSSWTTSSTRESP